jgi:hypothetical protein
VRRTTLILAAAAVLVPVLAGSATGAGWSVNARLVRCHPHANQAKRYAIFEGVMQGASTQRMEIRFDLLRAEPAGEFMRVAAPGLRIWTRAAAGVERYQYRKRVENLPAPASYRTLVLYRWRDSSGTILHRARALTPACEQPG